MRLYLLGLVAIAATSTVACRRDRDKGSVGDVICTEPFYADSDGDGYGDPGYSIEACVAPSGYVENDGDCDDADAAFHPGASEADCDDLADYNCDGSVGFEDIDGDGVAACQGDCDDARADVSIEADEVCDEVDNDCDGEVDDDAVDGAEWYIDYDGDTFGSDCYSLRACTQPEGYVDNAEDCDDLSRDAYPGGEEVCDGLDNNCDGTLDEGSPDVRDYYTDADGDGFGDAGAVVVACELPPGAAEEGTDCDDADASVNPDADELCSDGLDNDCDSSVDESSAVDAVTWYIDADEDGYGYSPAARVSCEQPTGYVDNNEDCDDGDGEISPDAVEVCDEQDNDCDGSADEPDASGSQTYYADADGDGFGDSAASQAGCSPASGYVEDSGDCDDADAAISPDAVEVCNDGIDNNCDASAVGCVLEAPSDNAASFYGESSGEGDFRFGQFDVNEDGVQDIILGASTQTVSGGGVYDGAVYVFFGPSSGGMALSDADVVISGRAGQKDTMGTDVVGLEDFDGDGIPDLGATASQMDTASGVGASGGLYIFSGATIDAGGSWAATDADVILYGEGRQHYLASVAADDFDDDGVTDVVLGATWAPDRSTQEGTVYLVYGGLSAGGYDVGGVAQATFEGEDAGDNLGAVGTVAAPGDVDGDGYADLLMSSFAHDTDDGAVYLALGPLSGAATASDADVALAAGDNGDYLGRKVEGAGDVNGDGYADLLIGAPWEDTVASAAGALFLVYGSSSVAALDGSTADSAADATLQGAGSDDAVGSHFEGRGDVDGDGANDLLVGQPGYGSINEGAAFFFYGPLSGTRSLASADAIFTGDTANDEGGSDLLFVENVDGSGTTGVLMDIPEDDTGATNAGAAYLILEFGL